MVKVFRTEGDVFTENGKRSLRLEKRMDTALNPELNLTIVIDTPRRDTHPAQCKRTLSYDPQF